MTSPTQAAQTAHPHELRGAVFMIVSAVLFTFSFAMVKDLTYTLPAGVIIFVRGCFALLCAAPLIVRRGPRILATRRPFGHLWRSSVGFASYFAFIYALNLLPFGDAVAIGYTQPLWSMLFGVVFFGERLGWRFLLTVAIGGAGVMLIAGPAGEVSWGIAFALANALCSAMAMAAIKRISDTEPPDRTTFYFTLYGATMGGIAAIFNWQTPNLHELIELAASGATFYVGQLCLTRAYTLGRLSRMSPLDFARLPVAILLGIVWFGEIPGLVVVLGMILIATAAASIMWEASRKAR